MADETLSTRFTGDATDLNRALRSAADNELLAARAAKQLSDSLKAQQKTTDVSSAATLALARSDKILTDEQRMLSRELDDTTRNLRQQGRAATETAAKTGAAGSAAKTAGGNFGLLASPMGAAVAAGVSLAPVLITLGAGLGGLGLAALPVIQNTREMSKILKPLKTDFANFSSALQPEVLAVFNSGVGIASGLLHDLQPVATATGKAFNTFLGRIDDMFKSQTWQNFFGFMAKTAGQDMQALGTAFIDLANDLPPLITSLQPVALGLLKITDAAANLPGAISKIQQAVGTKTPGPAGGSGLDRIRQFISWGEKHLPAGNKSISDLVGLTNKTGEAAAAAAPPVSDLQVNLDTAAKSAALAAGATAEVTADQWVLSAAAKDASSNVGKLNAAWAAFIGMSADLVTANLGVEGAIATMSDQAKKAGATFTGVNSQSRDLQQTFESSLLPSLENVIGGMKRAHAPTSDLALVVGTDLKKAADNGALSNKALAGQIYDLAVQAGYTGPNKIKPLNDWIDKHAGSAQNAADKVAGWAQKLADLPKKVNVGVTVRLNATGGINAAVTAPGMASVQGGGRLVMGGLAKGGRITAGTGPAADDVLIRASKGETVVSAATSRQLAPVFSAYRVPGYAAGGTVGGAPGWAGGRGQAFESSAGVAFARASVAAFQRTSAAALGGGAGGNVGAWIAASLAINGLPAWWAPLMAVLVRRESGGNPAAVNPISVLGQHATGIGQMLPSTFAAYTLGGSIWNPVANLVASERYIRAIYGSPGNIAGLLGGGTYYGYDAGGILPPGYHLVANLTGRPEQVIPARAAGGGGITVVLRNEGVIGSAAELEQWGLNMVNKLAREGKLTWALRRSASAA